MATAEINSEWKIETITDKKELSIRVKNFLKSNSSSSLCPVSISNIKIDNNIRFTNENKEEFQALIASIKTTGIIQPPVISVKDCGNALEMICIAGHRRLAAAKEIGYEQINCILRKHTSEKVQLITSIIENTHRKNLHSFEIAESVQKLVDCGYSFEELEDIFDRNQWNLRRYNKMNAWTKASKKLVLDNPEYCTSTFLLHLAAKSLTVQEVESHIKKHLVKPDKKPAKASLRSRLNDYYIAKSYKKEQKQLIEDALTHLGLLKVKSRNKK